MTTEEMTKELTDIFSKLSPLKCIMAMALLRALNGSDKQKAAKIKTFVLHRYNVI